MTNFGSAAGPNQRSVNDFVGVATLIKVWNLGCASLASQLIALFCQFALSRWTIISVTSLAALALTTRLMIFGSVSHLCRPHQIAAVGDGRDGIDHFDGGDGYPWP